LEENKIAFAKHFNTLEKKYEKAEKIVIINLVEETGKEGLLADAYISEVSKLNSKNLTYVFFDFHEHW